MQDQREKLSATRSAVLQPSVELHKEEAAASTSIVQQRDPLAQVSCRLGDSSCASAHAATLSRATASQPVRAGQSLLTLQRRYGNQYVQRVLALSGKAEGEPDVSPELEEGIQQARGGGQALDSMVRAQMEPAFGADFGGVSVHTDAQSDALNRELSARAFTTGRDIFFARGEYNPGSSGGRELIAHELTHVVQQTGEEPQPKLMVGRPGDVYEQEADEVARQVVELERQAAPGEEEPGRVQRQEEQEEEELQMQPQEEEEEIQMKSV